MRNLSPAFLNLDVYRAMLLYGVLSSFSILAG